MMSIFKVILKRIEDEKIEEIIIATSATIEGEMTALYIKNLFENREIKVYRIGYGLPAGGDIEYADEITLIKALEGEKKCSIIRVKGRAKWKKFTNY
jgi:recombination protein RecR